MMYERIKKLRMDLKMTQLQVAKAVGVTKATISMWESGNTSPKGQNLLRLASALKTDIRWLVYGVDDDSYLEPPACDVSRDDWKPVPLVRWDDIKSATMTPQAEFIQKIGLISRFLKTPEKPATNEFALEVDSESMYPDFYPGDVVFVDPDKAPKNGSYVIVFECDNDRTYLKQLLIDAGVSYLKNSNPSWPNQIKEIKPGEEICGVITGSYRKR